MAKAAINPPNCGPSDPRYLPECRFALEPSFVSLLGMAEKAGWDRRQTAYALMMLAAEIVQSMEDGSLSQP